MLRKIKLNKEGSADLKRSLLSTTIAVVAVSVIAVEPALAQIDEVVTTATRRTESVQDVPIAINTYTAEKIEKARIQDFQDLGASIPGFSINTFTKSRLNPSLRGGSSSLAGAGAEGAVGLFIDDLYYGGPGDFEVDLFDIERIEVLRGPQGTLFGRNTTGGSINVVTKKPTQETEGKLEVTYGNYDLLQVKGLLSGQVSDGLYGLISMQSTDRDGTSFNLTTGNDIDTINKSSVRGKLLWDKGEDFRATLSASATRHDETGIARDQVNFPSPVDNGQLVALGFVPEQNDTRVTTQFTDGRYESEQYTLGLRLEKDIDKGQLLSISSGRYFDSEHAPSSLAGAPIVIFGIGEPRNVKTISQEFRFVSDLGGKFDFVSGLYGYYSDESREVNATVNWDVESTAGLVQAQTFCTDPAQQDAELVLASCRGSGLITAGNQTVTLDSLYLPSSYKIDDNVKTTSAAIYAEGKYKLTDALTATLGGRWTYDKKKLDGGVEGAPDFVWNAVPGSIYRDSKSWDEFTYRAGLDWKVADDILLYASTSKGFRAGAYDVTTSDPILAQSPLDPETVFSHEAGFKSRFADGRVQLNATFFDTTYKNLQFFVTVPTAGGGVITANAGEANVWGIEVDFTAALTDNLTASFQYSHQEGTSQDIPEDTEIPEGTPPQGTIPNTYIASLDYEKPTANGGVFEAGIDFTHKDEYNLEFSDIPQFLSKTDALINARIGYQFPGEHVKISAWAKNILDEDIVTYGQDFWFPFYDLPSAIANPAEFDAAQPRYTDPATYGVTLGYTF